MKILITIFTIIICTQNLYAAAGFGIEPIYGVERSQREYPKPARYVTKTFLGMRGTYGTSLYSGEAEVSQSFSSEEFPAANESVDYQTQRAMVGIRSYPIRSQYVGVFFRAGVRAQIVKRKITEAGVSREEEDPLSLDPYAGTGITIAIANNFALSAGATLMYNRNAPSSEQYDTQYTFSFTIRAGNR